MGGNCTVTEIKPVSSLSRLYAKSHHSVNMSTLTTSCPSWAPFGKYMYYMIIKMYDRALTKCIPCVNKITRKFAQKK